MLKITRNDGITNLKDIDEKEDESEALDGNTAINNIHILSDSLIEALEERTQDEYKIVLENILRNINEIEYDGKHSKDIDKIENLAAELYNLKTIDPDDERFNLLHETAHYLDNEFNQDEANEDGFDDYEKNKKRLEEKIENEGVKFTPFFDSLSI